MSVQKEPVAVLFSVLTPLDPSPVPAETGLLSQTIKEPVQVLTELSWKVILLGETLNLT